MSTATGTDNSVERRTELVGAYGRDWMSEELPGVLAGDQFLRRFIRIFQDVADTVRWPADHLEQYVDATVAPIELVGWLGKWLHLEVDPSWDEVRQREFVRRVGPLFAVRGTPRGLAKHLEAVVGGRVEVDDGGYVRTAPVHGQEPEETNPEAEIVTITVSTTGDYTRDRLTDLIGLLVPVGSHVEVVIDESIRFTDPEEDAQ